jgi:hypothetical protein
MLMPDGHHATFNLAIFEQCALRGIPSVFIVNRGYPAKCEAAGIANDVLPALPILGFSQYQCPTTGETAFEQTKQLNDLFLAALNLLLTPSVSSGDLVVFHSVDARLLHGAARWLIAELRHKRFKVIVLLSGYDISAAGTLSPWQREIYKAGLQALTELGPDSVALMVETEGMRTLVNDAAGFDCGVALSPHFKPEAPIRRILERQRPRSGCPCIGFLGQVRPERAVPEAVRAVLEFCRCHPGAARFEMQLATRFGDRLALYPAEFANLERDIAALERLDDVNVIKEPLSTDAYYGLLERTDIVIQLKSGLRAVKGSGVFLEALSAGKVMVLPHGTEQHKVLESVGGAAVTVRSLEPTEIAGALWRAVEELDGLRERALAAAHRWNESSSLSAFFDRIVDR